MSYAVVLLTSNACEEYEGTKCVMSVIGPCTRQEAEKVLARMPDWASPHIIHMSEPWEYVPELREETCEAVR